MSFDKSKGQFSVTNINLEETENVKNDMPELDCATKGEDEFHDARNEEFVDGDISDAAVEEILKALPCENDIENVINETIVEELVKEIPNQNNTQYQRTSQAFTSKQNSFNENAIFGYIHNLSPIKKDKYFDFELQTKDKTVRGICFSPPKRKRFEQFSTNNSPVKIKKFRIDTKSNAEDYVMGNDVFIEHFPNINFEKREIPVSMNIATAKSVCVGQLVSLKAKVAFLHPPKYNVGPNNLTLQEAALVDSSDRTKFVLWQEYVGALQEGSTYAFNY